MQHTFHVDCQEKGGGKIVRQKAWLVGRKVQKSTQAEQGLGNGLGKKDGWEFGEVEREVIWEIGKQEVGGTEDVVYPLREVKDREKDVGEEVDTCTQTLEAFGNRIDNEVAGVEFLYVQEGSDGQNVHEIENIHDGHDDLDDPHHDYDDLDDPHDDYDDLDDHDDYDLDEVHDGYDDLDDPHDDYDNLDEAHDGYDDLDDPHDDYDNLDEADDGHDDLDNPHDDYDDLDEAHDSHDDLDDPHHDYDDLDEAHDSHDDLDDLHDDYDDLDDPHDDYDDLDEAHDDHAQLLVYTYVLLVAYLVPQSL